MKTLFSWRVSLSLLVLRLRGLVEKVDGDYRLTEKGKRVTARIIEEEGIDIWKS